MLYTIAIFGLNIQPKLVSDNWQLVSGNWQLATGNWQLATAHSDGGSF